MQDFEPLISHWHGEGEMPIEPLLKLRGGDDRRLGGFIVFSTVGEPAELPDSIAILGGRPAGEPQPMHCFDSPGIERMFVMALEGSIWTMWRAPGEDWNGPDGPGFNQRFIGQISADGNTIDGRWERGMGTAGGDWEIDFPMTFVRMQRPGPIRSTTSKGIPAWRNSMRSSAPSFPPKTLVSLRRRDPMQPRRNQGTTRSRTKGTRSAPSAFPQSSARKAISQRTSSSASTAKPTRS